MPRHAVLRSLATSCVLVALGQSFLMVLGPLTRADRAFGGSAGPGGIALLSSDSLYYLGLAASPSLLEAAPITRLALPTILRLGAYLGSAETLAVAVNLSALIAAGAALHRLVARYCDSSSAGVLAAAALVVNPLTAQWARFVLTETLFYTSIVGVLWATVRVLERRSPWPFAMLTALGAFVTLLRPNGVLVLAGALAAVSHGRSRSRGPLRRVVPQVLIWVLAMVVFFVGSREPDLGSERTSQLVIQLLFQGVVVEGTTEVLVTTPMPEPDASTQRTLPGALDYALQHPLDVAKLALLRIGYETLQVRPHYPGIVNVGMGVGIALFLATALVGTRRVRDRDLRTAVRMLAWPQVALIAGTFAVPESRYGWAYLVTFCVWVGAGAGRLLDRARGTGGGRGRVTKDAE